MSTTQPQAAGRAPAPISLPWATGFALFAGVMMLVVGVYHALGGIAAIIQDPLYVTTPDNYTYTLDVTTWGWIHLVLGVLIAATGGGVLSGRGWGRFGGITIAALSMIANFLFLPYYPVWSLVMIALCVAVIWALAVYDTA